MVRLTEVAYASAPAGKTAQARQLLASLQGRAKRTYVPSYDFAVLHTALGENEKALKWLGKAYEEHDRALIVLGIERTQALI